MSTIPFTSMIAWIVLTAFHVIQNPSSAETISEQQRFLHKTVHENAKVPCDFPVHRETITKLNAYLLRGVERETLYEVNWNNSKTEVKINSSEYKFDITIANKEYYAVFHLRNLQISDTDSYICKIDVIDPPPYGTNSSRTLIYVKDLPQSQEKADYLNVATGIPLGFFVLYSVIITAAVCYCWLKSKKNRVLQKDYFNMMPWQSNGPRKRPPQLGVPVRNYTAYRSWEP
ncbi:T-cell-specific surface glycoprotein CD28 isoform X2 [Python bivittatus]|uniref:T-cell-specific surface glycoprotein CD28 isoform X2 n=1 Tax=Python bivittatus TaxID=176946 RepID=A0A9F5MYP6_PYTBI|nr:T-cell-specific surface glycoprotein CD28 isoform X2 [Python bivittatus]